MKRTDSETQTHCGTVWQSMCKLSQSVLKLKEKKMKWSYKRKRIKYMNNNYKKYNNKNKEQVNLKLTIKWRVLKLRNIEKYAFKLRIKFNKYINKIYTIKVLNIT